MIMLFFHDRSGRIFVHHPRVMMFVNENFVTPSDHVIKLKERRKEEETDHQKG